MKISLIRSNYRLFKSSAKKLFLLFFYLKKTSANYRTNTSRSSAIVNMDNKIITTDYGRYFYILCVYFNYSGFDVVVKTNWRFFKLMNRYNKLLLTERFQFLRDTSEPINTVTIKSQKQRNKVIKISYGYNSNRSGIFDCIAPYPMHPLRYKEFTSLKQLSEYRDMKRKIRIFFSGNVSPMLYKKEMVSKEFDVIARWRVINFIKEYFRSVGKIQIVENKSILYDLMNSEEFVNSIVITEVKTSGKDWLKMLSKVDFFICPPGSSQPWCHNSIEAMSVGTIPILQYADLFTPVLENNKNCLIYTNFDELRDVIVKALEMNEREISIMRNEVIKYYCSYLSIECIEKKINEFINSDKEQITVALPFVMSAEDE